METAGKVCWDSVLDFRSPFPAVDKMQSTKLNNFRDLYLVCCHGLIKQGQNDEIKTFFCHLDPVLSGRDNIQIENSGFVFCLLCILSDH